MPLGSVSQNVGEVEAVCPLDVGLEAVCPLDRRGDDGAAGEDGGEFWETLDLRLGPLRFLVQPNTSKYNADLYLPGTTGSR
mmetsp:Transcript_96961/g.153540  ORF Transcript_96961/g.153540 Transcript_96961/m.153540 type:complete len:81 (-) Transcript_96961:58-300(-)